MRGILALLLLTASACTTWRTFDGPSPIGALEGNPEVIRVTRQDRSTLVIYNPIVQGDSLVGYLDKPDAIAARIRVAVSVTDIRQIEARKVDALRTGGLALGTTALVLLIVVAVTVVALFASLGAG